jgi:uncharacterized protein YyaL (SSP411 family)
MIRLTFICLLVLSASTAAQQHATSGDPMTDNQPTHTNRLANATSPYLLQHQHNPVDWYEWNAEALKKARDEDKPIFLSIGYSACHWCHVMAHESFENKEIAALMNEYFINIKVDREERPDLDDIYMRATVISNQGSGGWPMSVWLTPDLRPFLAGTYYPPDDRHGRPGFKRICEAVHQAWNERRDEVLGSADQLSNALTRSFQVEPGEAVISLDLIDKAILTLGGHFDQQHGGISGGGTNKFPPSMAMDLMLRSAWRKPADDAAHQALLGHVTTTLDAMAAGGIRDHLAGGWARYSTDTRWHVPHFEKMLYDQALVSRIYLDAYQFTGNEYYADVAREIFDYVLADLQSEQGGFYSSRDADSEGEEGKFYVWTAEEIEAVLGADDAKLFNSAYDVRKSGNWNDPHAPGEPKNVLRMLHPAEQIASQHGLSLDAFHTKLANLRQKLLTVRNQRIAPGRDTKILAEWNGLMIASLARGGSVLGEEKYTQAAQRAAEFILEHQLRDGRLLRAYRAGRVLESAFLTDYACMIEALLELYEATFEPRWLEQACQLMDASLEHFWDEQAGGFYFTSDDHEQLITRVKEVSDNATPSGNSVQLMNLARLAAIFPEHDYSKHADQMIEFFGQTVTEQLGMSERFLTGCDFLLSGPLEIIIVGDPQDPAAQALIQTARRTYLPSRVLLLRNPQAGTANVDSPLLTQREAIGGKPTVYVCRDRVCQLPVQTREALLQQLTPPAPAGGE